MKTIKVALITSSNKEIIKFETWVDFRNLFQIPKTFSQHIIRIGGSSGGKAAQTHPLLPSSSSSPKTKPAAVW
jgi:hypothetical protein